MTRRNRAIAVLLTLLIVAVASEPRVERYGDNYQIALPLLALGCEIANGRGLEYVGRYAVMFTGLHGTKRALGDAEINARPRGGQEGFPSGHTATATFGAATLVQSCVLGSPLVQTVVILAAAYTGGSRIESGAHTIWQVMAGALWGLICSMAFRPASPSRRWLKKLFGRI